MKRYYIEKTSYAFKKPYGIVDLETGDVVCSENGTVLAFDTMGKAKAYATENNMRLETTLEDSIVLFQEAALECAQAIIESFREMADRLSQTLIPVSLAFKNLTMPNNQRKMYGLPLRRRQAVRKASKNRKRKGKRLNEATQNNKSNAKGSSGNTDGVYVHKKHG